MAFYSSAEEQRVGIEKAGMRESKVTTNKGLLSNCEELPKPSKNKLFLDHLN